MPGYFVKYFKTNDDHDDAQQPEHLLLQFLEDKDETVARHAILHLGGLHCVNSHNFDLARQGYLNLLGGAEPANADTAAMLAARGRVHAAGIFAPLAAQLATQLSGRMTILDLEGLRRSATL